MKSIENVLEYVGKSGNMNGSAQLGETLPQLAF